MNLNKAAPKSDKDVILAAYASVKTHPDQLKTSNLVKLVDQQFNRNVSKQQIVKTLGSYHKRVAHLYDETADLAADMLLEASSGSLSVAQAIISKRYYSADD